MNRKALLFVAVSSLAMGCSKGDAATNDIKSDTAAEVADAQSCTMTVAVTGMS